MRIVDQRCEKLSHGLGVLEREVDKCRRLFYDLQASWEKEVQYNLQVWLVTSGTLHHSSDANGCVNNPLYMLFAFPVLLK
jgi:hypothetical protein